MKAANSVDDPKAIYEHLQDGLDHLPENKKVYEIPTIGKNGAFGVNVRVGAIENGKIVSIPIEK